MVVIHRAFGYRFVIYTQDHEPAHVHVIGAGSAKVDLVGPNGHPVVVRNVGIGRGDMRRLIDEVVSHQADFLAQWERIHGKRD